MKIFLVTISFLFTFISFAQQVDKILNTKEALRIESFLASDELKGRKPGTEGIDKAADFISNEFKASGLKTLAGLPSFKQTFTYVGTKFISATGMIDSNVVNSSDVIAISTDSMIKVHEKSIFKKVSIKKDDNLFLVAEDILNKKENQIVFVDKFFKNDFNKLKRFKKYGLKNNYAVVFVLSDIDPTVYKLTILQKVTSTNFTNVVGVLPGKNRKEEMVVFSSHYDHLGIAGKANAVGDSIYNGANDDAAGTTAVMMLANYFAKQKNNERTLVFVAFTAEEIGGFGSQYFSNNVNADKIVAMFNLEMIGTESKWGKNSAFITGYEKSDFGKILQKNLEGSAFHFEPDPYPKENLFYRSDNATLAALGVPAHTISTSKMDVEENYHQLSDEISTLNIDNMTEIIKAIAASSKTIVSGKDTPTRIEKLKL
jgi:hypothetical protein